MPSGVAAKGGQGGDRRLRRQQRPQSHRRPRCRLRQASALRHRPGPHPHRPGHPRRPRPFTTGAGAMYVKRADKATLTAEVGYKDIQARYLRWQIAGGARVQKGFERALTGLGLLPAGHVATPGAGLKLDAFGNIPRAQLVQILGQLKSGVSVFSMRGKRVSRQGLFVILPGATAPQARHLTPGIWRRGEGASWRDRHAVPLIHYIEAAAYHPRLDLEGAARRVVDARFPAEFAAAWQQAVSTAR